MSGVFGFSTEPSTGGSDYIPVLKFDARAGRFFRVDRTDTGQGFENDPVDITAIIKFVADFENIETGWIYFAPGVAPDFRLVPMGHQIPERPSPNHKNGIRMMLKLSKECAADHDAIREISGTAKAFLSAFEAVYTQYLADKGKYPGKLPVLTVAKVTPVKTGKGEKSSTNYHPTFAISGWAPRGDLHFVPKATEASPAMAALKATATAPSTGSTPAPKPAQKPAPVEVTEDEFG